MVRTNYFRVAVILMAAMAAAVLVAYGSASAQPASSLRITNVVPDGGSTVTIAASFNVVATFSKGIDKSTVTRKTFKLTKAGSNEPVPAKVKYFPDSKAAVLLPTGELEPGAYEATVVGGKKGVKSAKGAKLSGVDDPTASFEGSKVVWTFTVND